MEHLIGKGVDKAIQLIHRRRMEAWKGEGAPFVMEGNRRRFAAVASMIAGRELEAADIRGDTPPRPYWPVLYKIAHPALLPEHGFGWSDGETLFFPVSVVEMPDEAAREGMARALLFFLSFQVSRGTLDIAFKNRSLLSSDRLTADLFWIIENARLHNEILAEYPGVLREWAGLAGYLLEKRPSAKYLNKAEEKAEEFLKEVLESTFSVSTADARFGSRSAGESLRLAIEMKKKWKAEGIKTGQYRAIVPFFPWGKLIPERIKDGGSSSFKAGNDASAAPTPAGDERAPEKEGPRKGSRYAARTEKVDEKENENGLTLNIYDKIITWAEFVNVKRPFDDDPEEDPGKKADECEELTTASLERTTANTFNAELEKADGYSGAEEQEADPVEESFYYPEWDYKRRIYRPDYSRLVEAPAQGEDAGFSDRVLSEKRGLIREVTRSFEMVSPSVRLMGRQAEGTSIDLNAAVDAIADLEAGRTPDDRLYSAYVRTERDISALFLVDLSMSTDGWAGGSKIIDHEKESLVILCEAMKKLRDRYAIYGFSGKSRKGCRFFRVKSFKESYGEAVKKRIGGLIPYSYTRMGPAVRHAKGILGGEKARTKLLFILSDGKPNDVDVYEGRYGLEDTRMAIKEAEKEGITPFCLTVDTGASDYLPRVFGRGNYAVLPGVDMLAKKLPELYARIIHKL
ncbi:MAG: hypothetical protein H3C68_03535 [Deltaproteobacteria bacterium]|nr:hypothetical protein [Deltaproteobacteria bacterium]MBZ0219797.1 hypothetical protein [Deltaproteobacteria bacterium]